MKKTRKFLGIVVAMAAVGFLMAACGGGGGGAGIFPPGIPDNNIPDPKVTVTFMANDGSDRYYEADKAPGALIPFAVFEHQENPDFYLVGWNTEPDATGTWHISRVATIAVYEDITLYADWCEFGFAFDAATGTIKNFIGTTQDLVIPEQIGGVPVTRIGGRAVDHPSLMDPTPYEERLLTVIIPEGITYIGENAFRRNLLTEVEIPASVVTIGYRAFYDNHLESVTLHDGYLETIGPSAFQRNVITEVDIPETVTYIGASAFRQNRLVTVVIPPLITEIAPSAFSWNITMTSVFIPDTVTRIGLEAFRSNPLVEITIGSNVTFYHLLTTLQTMGIHHTAFRNFYIDPPRYGSIIVNGVRYCGAVGAMAAFNCTCYEDGNWFRLNPGSNDSQGGTFVFTQNPDSYYLVRVGYEPDGNSPVYPYEPIYKPVYEQRFFNNAGTWGPVSSGS